MWLVIEAMSQGSCKYMCPRIYCLMTPFASSTGITLARLVYEKVGPFARVLSGRPHKQIAEVCHNAVCNVMWHRFAGPGLALNRCCIIYVANIFGFKLPVIIKESRRCNNETGPAVLVRFTIWRVLGLIWCSIGRVGACNWEDLFTWGVNMTMMKYICVVSGLNFFFSIFFFLVCCKWKCEKPTFVF